MWLIPCDCFPSAPASDGLTSVSDSPLSIGECQFAPWHTSSGKPMQRQSSWRGWKTRPWNRLLFGAGTLRMCDGGDGVEQWISSRRGSPASPGPAPASAKAARTPAGSGRISFGASWTWNPDTSAWRMYPALFPGAGLSTSFPGLPKTGSMRLGSVSRRPPLALRTDGSEYSSWPTPDTAPEAPNTGSNKKCSPPGLGNAALQWTTPQAHDVTERGAGQVPTSAAGNACLARDARMWATPQAGPDVRNMMVSEQKCLTKDVANWQTPGTPAGGHSSRGLDRKGEPLLAGQVKQWQTPSPNQFAKRRQVRQMERNEPLLPEQACRFSPPAPPMDDGQKSLESIRTSRRRLNPAFTSWLMGSPWWWTRAEPTNSARQEMESWLLRLRSLLRNCCGESPDA